LTQPIDTATAAAGDPIHATLAAAIRSPDKTVLIAKNTVVLARIVQIERLYGIIAPRVQSLRVGIKIESLEVDGVARPFFAELGSIEKSRIKVHDGLPHEGPDIGTSDRLLTRQDLGSFDQMLNPRELAVGYLMFDDTMKDFVIRAGVEMDGETSRARS
jgi:hypothetical protein